MVLRALLASEAASFSVFCIHKQSRYLPIPKPDEYDIDIMDSGWKDVLYTNTMPRARGDLKYSLGQYASEDDLSPCPDVHSPLMRDRSWVVTETVSTRCSPREPQKSEHCAY
jgi:hypothetical protein